MAMMAANLSDSIDLYKAGTKVRCARDRCKKHKGTRKNCVGVLTGGKRVCTLEGCRGRRLGVRWRSGKVTFPCARGMTIVHGGNGWRIL